MRSFVTQPGCRLLMALAAVLAVSTAAAAQEPQQTPPPAAQDAPAQPDPMKFSSGVAMVVNEIKPDKGADFEAVWGQIRAGLAASENPDLRQQATALRIYKLGLELPAGANLIYVFFIDPVPALTFDPVKILYESGAFERAKADELYGQLNDAYAQITPWPLVPVGR